MAASTDKIGMLELLQVQNEQGPCIDTYRSGAVVAVPDLRASTRWPRFSHECIAAGFPSVCAVPLRLRAKTLGCLNLFMSTPVALTTADVDLAQALADVASIAITQDETARVAADRESQLRHALESRIIIEQAKGMIAEYLRTDMDEAFRRLRSFARSNNRQLTEVARSIVTGAISSSALRTPPP